MRLAASRATRTLTLTSGYGTLVPYFVARELRPGRPYVLKAKVGGRTHRFDFRTANRPTSIP
jgi:hypothetical protein